MKVGTKSILWGVHCFLVHPLLVALAWKRLYGFPWDIRLWVAFFVHDLGYWGKSNMDGPEGETHPELGGRIMGWLFDFNALSWRFTLWWCWHNLRYKLHLYNCFHMFTYKWEEFTAGHSRYYAKTKGIPVSRLCAADKLAFCFEYRWFYLLRARLSGELYEYLRNSNFANYINNKHCRRHWFNSYRQQMLRWVAGNYKNTKDRVLKNGDKIRISGMRYGGQKHMYTGIVHDLQDGSLFSLRTKGGVWLVGLSVKNDKFEFL